MTDELRNPNPVSPSTSRGPRDGGRTRRAYDRPELVELGSVRDLTRGASNGSKKDNKSKRRN